MAMPNSPNLTVRRREYLAISGLAISIATAGCLSPDGPEDVAEAMLEAIYEPDQQEALELSHRDGPAADTFSGRVFMPDPGTEAKDISTEIIEEEDDRAIVEINYEVDRLGEEPEENTRVFELRTNDDDEWKVWSIEADHE